MSFWSIPSIATALFLLLFLIAPNGALATEVPPPDGSDCWGSNFAILQTEISNAVTPGFDLGKRRTYVFCPDTVYRIASLDPPTGAFPNASAGEQWPIIVFTPNVYLSCPTQDCVLELNAPEPAVFAANTDTVAGSGLIPNGFTAPPSRIDNFTVDGFVVRQAVPDTIGVVTLHAPGLDILIKNCIFEGAGLASWAIASEYYQTEADLQGAAAVQPYYQSITVQDCTFSETAYKRSVIIGFPVGLSPNATTNSVTLERLNFDGSTSNGDSGDDREWPGLLSFMEFATVTAIDLCFTDTGSPTGAVIATMNSDSTISGVFSSGSFVTDNNSTETCLDSFWLTGNCVPSDAETCPLTGSMSPSMQPSESLAPSTQPSESLAPSASVPFYPGIMTVASALPVMLMAAWW